MTSAQIRLFGTLLDEMVGLARPADAEYAGRLAVVLAREIDALSATPAATFTETDRAALELREAKQRLEQAQREGDATLEALFAAAKTATSLRAH